MEQLLAEGIGGQETPKISYKLWELRNAVNWYLIERNVGHYCQVTISLKENWFEFEGLIDSQWTRAVLFSLVPPENGKRHIVDKLKIVSDPLEFGHDRAPVAHLRTPFAWGVPSINPDAASQKRYDASYGTLESPDHCICDDACFGLSQIDRDRR